MSHDSSQVTYRPSTWKLLGLSLLLVWIPLMAGSILGCVVLYAACFLLGRWLFTVKLDTDSITGPKRGAWRRTRIPLARAALTDGSAFEEGSFHIVDESDGGAIMTEYLSKASCDKLRVSLMESFNLRHVARA